MATKELQQVFFTVDQVADMFQLSKRTIWRMIKRGELKTRKFGVYTRIHADEVERFAKEGTGK